MKEFEGTDGPWWLEDEYFSTDGEDSVITCEARYGMVEIARIGQGGTQRDIEEDFANEQRANALLMAAAPELLGALQELLFLYKHDEGCRALTEYVRAESAIKKALGE